MQVNGKYQVKAVHLEVLHRVAVSLCSELKSFQLNHVKRDLNAIADRLANRAVRLIPVSILVFY